MKRILFALISVIMATGLMAEVMEIITLRNGNIYSGYIWMQLANGEIVVKADTSVVYMPMSEVDRIVRMPVKGNDRRQFADIYRTIADSVAVVEDAVVEELAAYPDTAAVDMEYVYVDSVASSSSAYIEPDTAAIDVVAVGGAAESDYFPEVIRNVELLEEGSVIKYRDANPRDITLRMKDVRLITRPLRDPSLLNGLRDEIVTKGGQTYTGQIVSNEPGKSVRINDNGRIYHVALSDIAIQRRVAIDPSESVVSQAPLLDNVYLRKDGGVLLDVVLIEQNFSRGTFDVIDRNNVVTRRNLADISKIRKHVNKDYRPRKEFAFEKDSVYINRKVVTGIPYERKGDKIKAKFPKVSIPSFTRDNGCIILEGSDNMTNKRMILIPVSVSGSKEIMIDMTDLIDRNIPVSSQDVNPRNNILRRAFNVNPGYYAFINTENSSLILFRVI